MTNSRNKGAQFERDVAKELFLRLGISFKRDLDQSRERDRGDLIASDPEFPFLIECKSYAKGHGCKEAWQDQARTAADGTGKHPVVIYKYNNAPWRCYVWMSALAEGLGGEPVRLSSGVDMTIGGFCQIAREIMARRAA